MRFCQQCGRFQSISEFEGNKKTCRYKLDIHNAQRRRKKICDGRAGGRVKKMCKTEPPPLPELPELETEPETELIWICNIREPSPILHFWDDDGDYTTMNW